MASTARLRWEEMDKSQLPLATAVEHYLTARRTEGKTPKTLFDYREKLSRFVAWQSGTLGELDLTAARAFVAHLQETPKWEGHPSIPTSQLTLSAQTVACYVRALKGLSTWLNEEGYLADNALRRLAKPKVPTRITEVLSNEEVSRLLSSVDADVEVGARNLAILVLFLDTGLRLSELVGAQVDDLHLADGWLKVYGKGDKERIVPFGSRTTKVLDRYVGFFRPDPAETEALFVNQDGSAITQNTGKQFFDRLRVRARLPRLHPHLLRHTFATNYLLAGGDVFSLQAILGHTTLEMTRRYVNLASSQVAVQHRKFSPMDRLSGSSFWVPSPSSPKALWPQHLTPPPTVSAHVCSEPAEMAATPLARPETSTGMLLCVVVPSPSRPSPL
jgi:site-specific recombinase XerD